MKFHIALWQVSGQLGGESRGIEGFLKSRTRPRTVMLLVLSGTISRGGKICRATHKIRELLSDGRLG